ncbi:hypothetical protein B0J12DRAFT_668864 [Macrophomina phaseolina]|uniref:RRM domain-containing protein n=1 Tax=Macrophomina phaseolina TaxID=35725 RepID=A0ABQ8G5U0_9PEZI|nr:hypothetical protein B0J12DRAFT_668864 [Macrophomina phaseolina]
MATPVANATAFGDRISIDQQYFRLLFMRAQSAPVYDAVDLSFLQISPFEYEFLTRCLTEYLDLRKNLLEDGVLPETLAMYIQPRGTAAHLNTSYSFKNHPSHVSTDQSSHERGLGAGLEACGASGQPSVADVNSQPSSISHDCVISSVAKISKPAHLGGFASFDSSGAVPFRMSGQTEPPDDKAGDKSGALSGTKHPPLKEQRTLEVSGLPPDTSLLDVLEHVKGGMLLDICRRNDRTACISYFRAADAEAFRNHVRNHDIYISNKRVNVDWANRQFYPNRATYNKIISNGATRILRLCNAVRILTEQVIREDMEHIHNLVILQIKVEGNDMIIHTNSIQNCGFARTCMMSRMPYRLLKINFVPDVCAEPLPQRVHPNLCKGVRSTSQRRVKPQKPTNLYEILNDDSSEEDNDPSQLQRSKRRDSAFSGSPSGLYRPRSVDSDARSY